MAELTASDHIDLIERWSAPNYAPMPVVIAEGEGAWVTDVDGRRYLDMLAGYSALNFGHRNPDLVKALREQLERVTLTSRAFQNDQLGPFCQEVATLVGMETVLPMNSGAEGVETAIKLARRWGYTRRGIDTDRAKIITCEGNFHGRTTTVISFSTEPSAREGFGPFTPGFTTVPFGDAEALEAAIDDETAAFLVEPVQGERGVVLPPDGYLSDVRRICSEAGILMIADEIQSGLGRTGTLLACDRESVVPDVLILGKALGGGMMPVSAVLATRQTMSAFTPGSHGSTFGGNPLACAIGRAVVHLLDDALLARVAELGDHLRRRLEEADLRITEMRSRGLWFGLDLDPDAGPSGQVCRRLAEAGVLTKETHGRTLRLSPPFVVTAEDLDWATERIASVLGA